MYFYKIVKINKYEDIEKILYDKQNNLKNWYKNKKSILIIDEAQKLFNKRLSMSKNNRIMNNFVVLSRKCNMDICFIAQNMDFLDKQQLSYIKLIISCMSSYPSYNEKTWEDDINVIYKIRWQKKSWDYMTLNYKRKTKKKFNNE